MFPHENLDDSLGVAASGTPANAQDSAGDDTGSKLLIDDASTTDVTSEGEDGSVPTGDAEPSDAGKDAIDSAAAMADAGEPDASDSGPRAIALYGSPFPRFDAGK